MNTKTCILYIDDTGAAGAGTYAPVPMTVSSDSSSEWSTAEERCRGEAWVTESPDYRKGVINAELKFKKGSAILQRFVDAHDAGEQIGVLDCTGDRTVSGNEALEMNALIKVLGMPKPAGDYVKYNVSMAPHADNTDTDLPRLVRTA